MNREPRKTIICLQDTVNVKAKKIEDLKEKLKIIIMAAKFNMALIELTYFLTPSDSIQQYDLELTFSPSGLTGLPLIGKPSEFGQFRSHFFDFFRYPI
jgi:hypothetical protein